MVYLCGRPRSRKRVAHDFAPLGSNHVTARGFGDRFVEHPVPPCARPPPPTSPSPTDAAVAPNRNSQKGIGDGGQQAAAAARSDGGAPLARA